MLYDASGRKVLGGSHHFRDNIFTSERSAKIHIRLIVADREVDAILDTGAQYSMLNNEVAEYMGVDFREGAPIEISTRYGLVRGRLQRCDFVIPAEEGSSLALEAAVFVSEEWSLNTFIGYSGFLDHLSIGLDPQKRIFFFGSP